MKKRRDLSILTFGAFLLALTSNILAAPIGSGRSSTGLDPIINALNSAIPWMEVASLTEFLIWVVVPALGLYAIFRFVYGAAFKFAESNFKDNTSLDSSLSDTGEWSARALAAATATVTIVVYGGLLGLAMLVAGVAGILWFIWANAAGLKGTTFPNPFGGNDNVEADGGAGIKPRLDDDEREVEGDQERIDEIGEETEDAEETGNDEEARDAAQKEEKVVMSIEDIETDLEDLLNLESEDLQNALKEAQDVINKDKQEIKGLRSIQGRYERVEGLLQALRGGMRNALENKVKLTNGNLRRVGFTGGGWSYANANNHGYDVQGAGFKHALEDIEEGAQQVQQISKLENQEEQEVNEELQTVQREANNFLEAFDLIKKVNTEINEMEKEDKELEQIAEELGDRKLMKLVKKEEKQELSLEKQLDQLRNKEGMIKSELEKALQLIDQEMELDQEEIKEIKQEVSETNQIEQDLESIRNRYIPKIDIQEGGGGRGNANEEISKAENLLEQIQQGLSAIEQRKEKESQLLQGVEDSISQKVSKVS